MTDSNWMRVSVMCTVLVVVYTCTLSLIVTSFVMLYKGHTTRLASSRRYGRYVRLVSPL